MNFDFLVAYRKDQETDIRAVLIDLLMRVLEDNLNDFGSDALEGMIQLRHERDGLSHTDEDGRGVTNMLLGFVLDLPDEISQIDTVIDDFSTALFEAPPIFHVVKFEDPLLRAALARYAGDIFALEMKLRRVLTLIYLHASPEPEDAYNLLRDESVQPIGKEKIKAEQMRAATENQFFHLTFGQYVGLNQRPEFKLPALLSVVRDAESYDAFRAEIDRPPISQEDDAVLLAGLKERMEAIETMRNCVAHNRRPTKRTIENYDNARPLLDRMLDEYLARYEKTNGA